MSDDTVENLLKRIRSYVLEHEIDEFQIIFHGGEPLLAGKEFYKDFVASAAEILTPVVKIIYSVQTNGVLLDDEWCSLFKELNIYIGISFDGTEDIHNKFRVYHSGKGSFTDVMKGMQISRKYQGLSVLSVVNVWSDPEELFDLIKGIGAISYDILLPDATHDDLEDGIDPDPWSDSAPYGDWLIRLYDRWKADRSGEHITIQFLESIIKVLLGETAGNALIGNGMNNLLVIQTDGSYESALKTGVDGFTRSGIGVHANEIDEACDTDLVRLYLEGHHNLSRQCKACPISNICGGGLVSHRFSRKNGFDNPSVYCRDLMKIITHIQNDFLRSLPAELLEEEGLEMLTYEEGREILRSQNAMKDAIHSAEH